MERDASFGHPIPASDSTAMRRRGCRVRAERGFTLLELMIVVAILAILASISVPQYVAALRTARVSKARQDLKTIATAIDSHRATNGGRLPLTLYQVGFGGRRDPWGVPYCYFNYGDGTGDGLDWAVAAGLVDPAAVVQEASGSSDPWSGAPVRGSFGIVVDGAFGVPAAPARRDRWRSHRASGPTPQSPDALPRVASTRTVANELLNRLSREVAPGEADALASSLASATSGKNQVGPIAVFTEVPPETVRRRDRFMFPLNTDYDLFSLGPDGRTSVALGDKVGLDDVIRANNGGFFGTAAEY